MSGPGRRTGGTDLDRNPSRTFREKSGVSSSKPSSGPVLGGRVSLSRQEGTVDKDSCHFVSRPLRVRIPTGRRTLGVCDTV